MPEMPQTIDAGKPAPQSAPKTGRDERIDELTGRWRETQRARDSAIQQLSEITAERDTLKASVSELQRAVSELREAVKPQKAASPWPEYGQLDDAELWRLATQTGAPDPVTGQAAPPHPAVMGRSLSEIVERRARALAEKIAGEKVSGLETRLTESQKKAEGIARAEQQLLAVYGESIKDPKSDLRQAATRLAGPIAQEYGQEFLSTPAGLKYVFAEAQRMLHASALEQKDAEIRRLREESARLAAVRGPEHDVVQPAPTVKGALFNADGTRKGNWRDAIREGMLARSLRGERGPSQTE